MAPVAASSPEILGREGSAGTTGIEAGQVEALTGYRGFAALVVLVVHASGRTEYPWIGLHGYGPVALFTLSGYLLVGPWSKWAAGVGRRPDLRSYARRRVARIFPAYLLALVVVALVYPASRPKDGESWLRAVTLTNFLQPDGLRPAMEHVWSMGTEFSWYFALPLLGGAVALLSRRLLPRRSHLVMGVAVALSAAVTAGWLLWIDREVDDLTGKLTYPMWLPAFLVCFMAGALVKHLEVTRPLRGKAGLLHTFGGNQWVVLAAALASVAVLVSPFSGPEGYVPLTFSENSVRLVAAFALAFVLVLGIAFGPASAHLNRWLSRPWLVTTGRWSYGVYLWHLPVTVILYEHLSIAPGPVGFATWLAFVTVVSLGLGAMTYAWVEKPAIAWSKR